MHQTGGVVDDRIVNVGSIDKLLTLMLSNRMASNNSSEAVSIIFFLFGSMVVKEIGSSDPILILSNPTIEISCGIDRPTSIIAFITLMAKISQNTMTAVAFLVWEKNSFVFW